MLPMFYPWEQLPFGGPVALQFIGDDDPRHVGQLPEQLVEELLRRPLIAPTLHQDVEHVALLIHRPPEIMTLALDREKHLVHVPFITRSSASAPELISILLSKFAAPLADGLIGHKDSAFK